MLISKKLKYKLLFFAISIFMVGSIVLAVKSYTTYEFWMEASHNPLFEDTSIQEAATTEISFSRFIGLLSLLLVSGSLSATVWVTRKIRKFRVKFHQFLLS